MSNLRPQRRLFNPRQQAGSFATYAPPVARIDGRAPVVEPDLGMTKPHDFSGFDGFFHPKATTTTPAARTTPAPKAPAFNGTSPAAPNDINGSVVQGLLDKASGLSTPTPLPSRPPNPGAVARATGEQQVTPYGTVGADRPAKTDGTPIIENGKQVGIAGGVQQGPPAPTMDDMRRSLMASHPDVFKAGTPENAAFVKFAQSTNPATGQPYGEAGAHQNIDAIMKQAQVGPAAPTPSEVATSNFIQQQQDKAKADAGSFTPGSTGGKIASAINNAPNIQDAAGNAVTSAAKAIGLNAPAAKAAGDYVRTANPVPLPIDNNAATAQDERVASIRPGAISDTAQSRALARENGSQPVGPTMPSTKASLVGPPDFPPPGQPGGRPGGTGGVTSPLPSNFNPTIDTTKNPPLGDATPDAVPNYADGDLPDNYHVSLGENMQRANALENANRFRTGQDDNQPTMFTPPQPTNAPTPSQRAEAIAWKSDMQAANNALHSEDPSQGTTTQQLAGPDGVMATVPGNKPVTNYARGRVPSYAGGRKLFAPAMKREANAIKHGVGGAPRSAKPVPVMMAGQPAVVNTSEQIVPNAAGGYPAVLNRNQQRKAKMFVPGRN